MKEGEVHIFNPQKQSSVACYLFLFNDLLIFSEHQPKLQKYKFLKYKQLVDLVVKNSSEGKEDRIRCKQLIRSFC